MDDALTLELVETRALDREEIASLSREILESHPLVSNVDVEGES